MDREKVIKGLERHGKGGGRGCLGCPYELTHGCQLILCHDAIALLKEYELYIQHQKDGYAELEAEYNKLLKEQEAKQVIKQTYHVMINRDYENPVEVTRYDWLCPTCKSLLCRDIDVIDDNYHFCKVCGQAVKWE